MLLRRARLELEIYRRLGIQQPPLPASTTSHVGTCQDETPTSSSSPWHVYACKYVCYRRCQDGASTRRPFGTARSLSSSTYQEVLLSNGSRGFRSGLRTLDKCRRPKRRCENRESRSQDLSKSTGQQERSGQGAGRRRHSGVAGSRLAHPSVIDRLPFS